MMRNDNCATLYLFELTIPEPGITIIQADTMVGEDVSAFRVTGVKVGDILTLRIEDMGAFEGRGMKLELKDKVGSLPFTVGPHQEIEHGFRVDSDEETLEIWARPVTTLMENDRPVGHADCKRIMRLTFDTGVSAKKEE